MEQIQVYEHLDKQTFDELTGQDLPFIIRGNHFGDCHHKWNEHYLAHQLHNTLVKVHVANQPNLSFMDKNFRYETLMFDEFLEQCVNGDKYLYLRSIGNDKRGKDVANIGKQFPSLKDDLQLPQFTGLCACDQDECSDPHIFSSVLRISSCELVMWTHYDMLDNILVQIRGSKKVFLLPPSDAECLYLSGDKSRIVDLENVDLERYPLMSSAHPHECILEEGDALFIPSLWFHSTKALDFSIGVNLFWKDNHLEQWYDKSDVYGNKDLVPAVAAYACVGKAIKQLDSLPSKYRHFYMHMIIAKLKQQL